MRLRDLAERKGLHYGEPECARGNEIADAGKHVVRTSIVAGAETLSA